MGMELRLCHRFRCNVCRHLIDEDRARDDAVTAAIFGAKPYAICIGCKQEVKRISAAYKRRWDAVYFTNHKEVVMDELLKKARNELAQIRDAQVTQHTLAVALAGGMLADAFEALDAHLSNGGELPADWKKK
jgi:hypothetical protein